MPEIPTLALEKGLNLIAAVDALPEGATPDCGNVDIGAGGKVISRGGSTAKDYALPTVTGASLETYVMEEEGFPNGNPPTTPNATVAQLVFSGGRIYRTENTPGGVGGIIDIGSYTVPGAPTVGRRPYGVHFTDSLTASPAVTLYNIPVFGESAPLLIAAGSVAAPTAVTHADWTVPKGYPQTAASYLGRMWYAGSSEYPGRIWATDVGKAATFTVSAPPVASESFVIDLDLTSGGRIIGMKHLFDLLLIFTTRGIYRVIPVSGTIPFKAVFVSNLVAVSQHAIIQVESAVYFLTRSGVFNAVTALTYGDIKADEVSPALAPLFTGTEAWKMSGAFAVYNDETRKVHFFFEHDHTFAHASALAPLMTTVQATAQMDAGNQAFPPSVTECLTFDMRGGQWMRHFFPVYFDYAVSRDEGDGTIVIETYHRESTALIREHEIFLAGVTDDAGAAFTGYFRSKRNAFKSLTRRKTRFFPHVRVLSGAPTINASVDGGAFKATQGGTVTPGINRRVVVGSGSDIQLEFLSTAQFEVDSFADDLKADGKR